MSLSDQQQQWWWLLLATGPVEPGPWARSSALRFASNCQKEATVVSASTHYVHIWIVNPTALCSVRWNFVTAAQMLHKCTRKLYSKSTETKPPPILYPLISFCFKNYYDNVAAITLHYNHEDTVIGRQVQFFYRAMLCIRGICHGPVSVCPSVCHKSVFTKTAKCRIT